MKKIFNILAIVVALLFTSSKSYATLSFNMELKNIVQLNECTLRFDVYVKNTSTTPAVDAISIENWEFQVSYNLAMTNGGSLNTASCTFVPGTSDLESPNPLALNVLYPNRPSNGNTSAVPLVNPTLFQSFGSGVLLGNVITYLGDNIPKRIGTFQIVNKTSYSGTVSSKNFASVLHNLQLVPLNCILSTCPSQLTDVSDLTNGSVMKYVRSGGSSTPITSSTLTQPVLTNHSDGVNKPLYGYAYSGTGAYSLTSNWNIAVGIGGSGNQTLPTATTDNISIGYFTTAAVPVAVLGICTIDAGKTVGDLSINAGSQLTMNNGITTTAANLYINSNAANGTGTFVDLNPSGGLTFLSGGAANIQQYLPMGRNWYVSSPVGTAPTSTVTSAGNLWNYTEANTGSVIWNLNPTGNFGVTTGYVANMTASGNLQFTGTLNTGSITTDKGTIPAPTLTRTVGAVSSGFNLVGNPYPSFVSWLSALTASPTLEPTMWYRTQNASATYVFDTFNATPNVGTNNNGTAVTGYIPPMQAFWVRVLSTQPSGTLNFTNAMRSHQDVTTNRLRVKSVNSTQPLLRLQVSNGVNSDEAIVLFNANASDAFDSYDSEKMSNNNDAIPEIYTLAGTEKVVINGMKAVYDNQELPLGFNTRKENKFTIKATEISNFAEETQIILKDKLLNSEQELESNTAYTFSSDVTNTTDRFSIVFKTIGVTTGLNNTGNGSESVLIYRNQNGQITINRKDALGEGTVTVCNAVGQKLVSQSTTGTVTVVDKKLIPGVYLVRVNVSGQSTTKKIILN
jgi:hypothetical protein